MRAILFLLLTAEIVVARPPDPHAKKSQPTAPVQSEASPAAGKPPETPAPAAQPVLAATPASSMPESLPVDVSPEALRASAPEASVSGVRFQWFGHAFVYLTSLNGIRIAIDPFAPGSVKYTFPERLPADVVLISCENDDRTGSEELFGSPLAFRSVTGVGVHLSNGMKFKGIESWRDAQKSGMNTVYTFTIDAIRFCSLGNLGYPLNRDQKDQIGKADVLFVSVGNRLLNPKDFGKLVDEMGAKWIVPLAYLTGKNNTMDLRSLEEFDLSKYPVAKVTGNSFVFEKDKLPTKPTVLMLESP